MGMILLAGTSCQVFQENDEDDPGKTAEERFGFLEKQNEDQKGARATIQEEQVNAEKIMTPDISEEQLNRLEKAMIPPEKKFAGKDDISPFYADFILLDSDEKLQVEVAFNSAPIQDVIPAFADILGFNYIADPELKGVVSININSEMTRQELWHIFDKMLNLAGAGVLADDTLFRILPLAKLA